MSALRSGGFSSICSASGAALPGCVGGAARRSWADAAVTVIITSARAANQADTRARGLRELNFSYLASETSTHAFEMVITSNVCLLTPFASGISRRLRLTGRRQNRTRRVPAARGHRGLL